jgi:hypothetical protein
MMMDGRKHSEDVLKLLVRIYCGFYVLEGEFGPSLELGQFYSICEGIDILMDLILEDA